MLFQSRELPHFVILYAAIYAAFNEQLAVFHEAVGLEEETREPASSVLADRI